MGAHGIVRENVPAVGGANSQCPTSWMVKIAGRIRVKTLYMMSQANGDG